jgi:hypothetical protein
VILANFPFHRGLRANRVLAAGQWESVPAVAFFFFSSCIEAMHDNKTDCLGGRTGGRGGGSVLSVH